MTESVISRRVGMVVKVPKARYCWVMPLLETVTLGGTTLIEIRGSGDAPMVTEYVACATTWLLSRFVHVAVIMVEPAVAAVTRPSVAAVQGNGSPAVQIEATVGVLDFQTTWLVTSYCRVPSVPSAINWFF